MIRRVKNNDALAICSIYNYYIKNTVITFEKSPISVKEIEGRIKNVSAQYPWLVWEENQEIIGYAYMNRWRDRSAYDFSVEDSIYIKYGYEGKGMGKQMLSSLLEEAKKIQIHAVVAGITLPNEPSIALHEKLGFKKIAQFDEIGFKFERWLDVGYWELILS